MSNTKVIPLMNARQTLQLAKVLGIKGVFLKSFRSGQELREYTMPYCGGSFVYRIRARTCDHA